MRKYTRKKQAPRKENTGDIADQLILWSQEDGCGVPLSGTGLEEIAGTVSEVFCEDSNVKHFFIYRRKKELVMAFAYDYNEHSIKKIVTFN